MNIQGVVRADVLVAPNGEGNVGRSKGVAIPCLRTAAQDGATPVEVGSDFSRNSRDD
jgi:hypothetical protein